VLHIAKSSKRKGGREYGPRARVVIGRKERGGNRLDQVYGQRCQRGKKSWGGDYHTLFLKTEKRRFRRTLAVLTWKRERGNIGLRR